jgi:hypothetical protein
MSRDPDGFPFDPDPLHVDDDPDPRVPRHDPHPPLEDPPGCAIVFAIVGIPLLVCAAFAVRWLVIR